MSFDQEVPIEKVDFAVEATSFESLRLWIENGANEVYIGNDKIKVNPRTSWEELHSGRIVTIGHIGKSPVCVELFWNIINSHKVLFYHATSQVVDHRMVETWIHENALTPNGIKEDAMNFHNIIHAIERKNKIILGMDKNNV